MKRHSLQLINLCRQLLLTAKQDILNRSRQMRSDYQSMDKLGGDEADQTMQLLAENDYLSTQERLKERLLEIEMALARIVEGRFGVCEETEELIEHERLLAIPWTRVSIEGAELREASRRRFAR